MRRMVALALFVSSLVAVFQLPLPSAAESSATTSGPARSLSPTASPDLSVRPELIAWLQANAIPFTSLSLGCGCEDLRPLMDTLGEARIVGLGEATHGTSEFHRSRARLVECLVTERGFNLIATECGWSEVAELTATLTTAGADPGGPLHRLDWYNTEEMLDLLDWIQDYNQSSDAPVELIGLDMQYDESLVAELLAYIAETQPGDLNAARAGLECFRQNVRNPQMKSWPPLYSVAGTEIRERCKAGLVAVRDLLVRSQQAYEEASSPEAFARALRTIVMLQQAEELFAEPVVGKQIALRDDFMAQNVSWLLEQAEPEARMILWAHNGHVSTAVSVFSDDEAQFLGLPTGTEYRSMGAHLRAKYGGRYRAVGFAFHHGAFNAYGISLVTGAMTPLGIFAVDEPVPGGLEATFAQVNLPQFYVDLIAAGGDPEVGPWFRAPGRVTAFGAAYAMDDSLFNTAEIVLSEAYSLLVFFHTTTPSRLRE